MRRIAYRSGIKGAGSLFPRDAVLNLPPCGYSWPLQRLAEMFTRSGSYEQAHEFVLAATGVSIGKRQLEQITVAAAADAERFCQDRAGPRDELVLPGTGEEGGLPPLAISADGKGVAMRPEARRQLREGPGKAGADLLQAGRDRGEEGLQADGRDRVRLRRPAAGAAADAGGDHDPGTGRARPRAQGGEPLVHLRYHRQPRRDHRRAA